MSRVVHIDLPRNERYDDRDLSYAMDRSMMLHERSENPVSRSSRRHRASYAPESDGYLETHIRPHLTTCHSCGSTLETHANHIHLTASNDPMVLQEMARKYVFPPPYRVESNLTHFRNNQVVQRLNSKLPSESIFGQIHLKQLPNGRYPLLPSHMTLDQFRALSGRSKDFLR